MDPQPRSGLWLKKNAIEQAYADALAHPDAVMWFEDEANFYRHATAARAWAVRGRRQPHAHGVGAPNMPWRVAAGLDPVHGHLCHRNHRTINAATIGQFNAQLALASAAAQRIYLVMDNWPVHHHVNALRPIARDPRVRVLWLPTYAPWLNPVEKVWKYVRQHYAHMHQDAEDFNHFGTRLSAALDQAAQDSHALLRYTGTGNCKLYS